MFLDRKERRILSKSFWNLFPKSAKTAYLLCYSKGIKPESGWTGSFSGKNGMRGEGFMIEMIRQTEDTVKLPKNIRQIGNPANNWKIYVEDYVYTYLHPATEQERAEKKVCVLFGKVERAEKNYIFISGAIAVEPLLKMVGLPEFTEEAWEYIYQQAKEYFSDFEIVGWSVMTSFWPLHLLPEFENLHRRYFEGADKVMLLMNPDEQEEHFYRLAGGNLSGQSGYYIYYEKNEAMQSFMVQQHQKEPAAAAQPPMEEKTIAGYRARMQEKQSQIRPKAEHSILCAAGVLTAMAACVIGITTINNYEKMAGMQDAIQVLSQSASAQSTEHDAETFQVENMESSIKPLEEQNSTAVVQPAVSQEVQEGAPQPSTEGTAPSQPEDTQQTGAAPAEPAQTEQNPGVQTAQADASPTLSEAETYKLQGYYIVEKGDSLAVISQKIYQNKDMIPQICEKNGIADENTIYIGQKLLLP